MEPPPDTPSWQPPPLPSSQPPPLPSSTSTALAAAQPLSLPPEPPPLPSREPLLLPSSEPPPLASPAPLLLPEPPSPLEPPSPPTAVSSEPVALPPVRASYRPSDETSPSYYPPTPDGVPADLTEPTPKYKQQIALVTVSLAVFFGLYFGILALCVCFFIWAFISVLLPLVHVGFTVIVLLQFLLCVPLLALFIYMAKNLFHWGATEKTDYVEVFAEDQPRLFAFIERVCEQTGAPYPNHVYVNYEVNAMAFPDGEAFWHLFVPTGKNLLIGLGLVNSINLTEFQALLAHEFGHFSQKSSKLGAYVYRAQIIMNNIVDGHDFVDRLVDDLRYADNAFAFVGWAIYGILWALRGVLIGMRYVVFAFHSGLSRQMEFNADLVAVSVTGSDAPVHLLYRSAFAERCMTQTVEDMQMLHDHHRYTDDMFYHQRHSVEFIRKRDRKPRLGEPPPLPADARETTRVFEPDDDDVATMWSTHPANRDRERNAKALYIRSTFDERSPWVLFDNVRQLRGDATYRFYRIHMKVDRDEIVDDCEKIQTFIDEERAETTYDPRYHGLYDCRTLQIEGISDHAEVCQRDPWSPLQLADAHQNLYDRDVEEGARLHNQRMEEVERLTPIAHGWKKPRHGEFEFRGDYYRTAEAKRLLRKVKKELKRDRAWLRTVDEKVFGTFLRMAQQLGDNSDEDLIERYRFQLNVQNMWLDIDEPQRHVEAVIACMNDPKSRSLGDALFYAALEIFRDGHLRLRGVLQTAERMTLPHLKNLPAGEPLRDFLLEAKLVDGVSMWDWRIKHKWINRFARQLGEVHGKLSRIHFKSLGGILALQERIAEQWHAERANPESPVLPPPLPPPLR